MSSSDATAQTSCAIPSCTNCRKRRGTSPIAGAGAVSAPKKPKIDDNPTTIEIEEVLECGVCLDFPASPIHSCDNAHVLCGQCVPKLSACPTCKLPKLSPNPFCEKLAKKANKKIECPNLEAGCNEGVLSTKFIDHLPLCYFREITCNYRSDFGAKVKFHEYAKHLEDVHKQKIYIGPKITSSYLYDEKQHANIGLFYKWDEIVTKFESHEFIVNAQVSKQSQLFYSWASVLGDKDLADKYICDVKFKPFNEFGCSWKLPVLAFHEDPRNVSEDKLLEYLARSVVSAVPVAVFKKWGVLEENKVISIDVAREIKKA